MGRLARPDFDQLFAKSEAFDRVVYDAPEFTNGFLAGQKVSYFFSKTGKPFKTVDGNLTIELDAEGKITRLGAWRASARADLLQLTSGARRVELICCALTTAAHRARHAKGHPRRARLCVRARWCRS